MAAPAPFLRSARFALLERVALPLLHPPVRAWIATWRTVGPDPALVAELATRPRLIFAIRHGALAAAMVLRELWVPHGRRWVVLTTPSLDGRFAAAAIARLGVASVPMRGDTRGVASAGAFLACVAAGDVGCILVDGPRGPAGVVKAGVARTVAAARAEMIVADFAASAGVRLRSWDRTLLPAPLARVHVALRAVAAPASEDTIQAALDGVAAEAQRAARQRTG